MAIEVVLEAPIGTAAHFVHFLDWAESEGKLPSSTIQNWRNASVKVLELEDDWPNINVVKFDLDGLLSQFDVLKRERYTPGSMSAYKARTRNAIDAYRRWLADPGSDDWKTKPGAERSDKLADTKASRPAGIAESVATDGDPGFVPERVTMVEYPWPLRSGLQARLWLPEDLTEAEAKRLGRFVESLVIAD